MTDTETRAGLTIRPLEGRDLVRKFWGLRRRDDGGAA